MLEAVRPPATDAGAVEVEFALGTECRLQVCVTRTCLGLLVVAASGRSSADERYLAQQRRGVEHRNGRRWLVCATESFAVSILQVLQPRE